MRPSKHEYYLNNAKDIASRSTCLRRKYGAIIVNNDQIVSTGYNGSPRGVINCDDHGTCYRADNGITPGQRYEMCLVGSTKILLNTTTKTSMDTLYDERQWGIDCVSFDIDKNSIVNAKAEDIRISEFVIRLWEIELETGDIIRCTEEQKFLISDSGKYMPVSRLRAGHYIKGGHISNGKLERADILVKYVDIFIEENGEVPVYDITVPGYENFAIALENDMFIFAHNCHSVHAEANAILSASRRDMLGATLYLVGIDTETNQVSKHSEPCMMCRRYIINAGIKEVIMLGQVSPVKGSELYIQHMMVDELIEIENATFKPEG